MAGERGALGSNGESHDEEQYHSVEEDVETPLVSCEGSLRPHRHRVLGLLPLVALIFYEVSGGPFGIEVITLAPNSQPFATAHTHPLLGCASLLVGASLARLRGDLSVWNMLETVEAAAPQSSAHAFPQQPAGGGELQPEGVTEWEGRQGK
jgi:hypothetical protein